MCGLFLLCPPFIIVVTFIFFSYLCNSLSCVILTNEIDCMLSVIVYHTACVIVYHTVCVIVCHIAGIINYFVNQQNLSVGEISMDNRIINPFIVL